MALTTATPALLTTAEAARILRLNRSTVYRLIDSGQLPAIRIGGVLRIDQDQLTQWIYGTPDKENGDGAV